jgi:PadR family transcriptional regulator, regulatory protein PadR
MSNQTFAVLQIFFKHPSKKFYGLQILDQTGLKSGTVYPLLVRLAEADRGWLESELEDIDPVVVGRKPRRFYKITSDGIAAVRAEQAIRKGLMGNIRRVLHVA